MSSCKLCSIIIPVYNKSEYTHRCLEKLFANTDYSPLEIIVVDNNSTDNTHKVLNFFRDKIRVIRNQKNLGFAKACNQGAEAANGEYIVFLNNDTEPLKNWLSEMIKTIEEDNLTGIVGSKLLFPDGTIQHVGVTFAANNLPYHIYHYFDTTLPFIDICREVKAVTAACMLIKKSLFMELGKFHEEYINGLEDVDLCLNAIERGYLIKYTPLSRLIHYESISPGRLLHAEQNTKVFESRWKNKKLCDDYLFFLKERRKRGSTPLHIIIEIDIIENILNILNTIYYVFFSTQSYFEISIIGHNIGPEIGQQIEELKIFCNIYINEKSSCVAFKKALEMTEGEITVYMHSGVLPVYRWFQCLKQDMGNARRLIVPYFNFDMLSCDWETLSNLLHANGKINGLSKTIKLQAELMSPERLFLAFACHRDFFKLYPPGEQHNNTFEYFKSLLTFKNEIEFYFTDNLLMSSTNELKNFYEIVSFTPTSDVQKQEILYSLVIVTYNSLKDILDLLISIIKNSMNYEIIVVDNNSNDGTQEFLKILKYIKVVFNQENCGFSAAVNQGIRLARGKYVVLLNPDTVVTKDWLSRLHAHFIDQPVGAVGPLSNYVAGLQKYSFYHHCDFGHYSSFDEMAEYLYKANKGWAVETKLLIGFCLMISRDVIEKVGMLDEELFLGNDDLELSFRLRMRGYHLVVACDTFIHHKGQKSFSTVKKLKTDRLLKESTDILYNKLQKHYGEGMVPGPEELWGIIWFKPSDAIYTRENEERVASILDYVKLLREIKNPLSIAGFLFVDDIASILDIGTGTGETMRGIQAKLKIYIDIDFRILRRNSESKNLICMDARNISFIKDKSIDVITIFNTLEYIKKKEALNFLKEIENKATRQILIFISTPTINETNFNFSDENKAGGAALLRCSVWSKEFFLSRGYDVWNIFPSGSDRSCGFFAFKIFSQSQRHRLRCRVSEISGGEQNRFYFAKNANSNLVSIIILCYNQIDYTKQCLNSIKLNTKMLYELIIVDNGSSDDTVDYLRQQADITLIMNETNKGVAGGWNQGIKCASGDYILILNNDVIVTDDWLENMVECLERNKESGAVGPMSNYVAGHQLESNITYVSLNELYSFAKEYHSKNRYRQQRVDTLIGFCLLLKRETVEKVGLFDERYGIGNFEDNDYCIRMIQQGFRLYIAKDSFIHHFGSRSFAGNNINYEKQMVKNYKIFLDKWKNAWDVSLMDKDLLVMGYDCIDQNKLSEAEKNFEQAVQINPQNFEALNNLGCIRYQQSRDAEAFELLKKALEINPLYELALLNLMDVARELGKEKEAERYMEKAASLDANLGKR